MYLIPRGRFNWDECNFVDALNKKVIRWYDDFPLPMPLNGKNEYLSDCSDKSKINKVSESELCDVDDPFRILRDIK